MSSPALHIFLDLDDVLADQIPAALAQWNLTYEEVLFHWKPGSWGIHTPATEALRANGGLTAEQDLTLYQFYKPMRDNESFWANLKPTQWFAALLERVTKIDPDYQVATCPIRCPACYAGKMKWAAKYWSDSYDRVVPLRDKSLLANENSLLIDDSDDNVKRFIGKGGYGIVFPRHHNSAHYCKENPLDYLERGLQLLADGYR